MVPVVRLALVCLMLPAPAPQEEGGRDAPPPAAPAPSEKDAAAREAWKHVVDALAVEGHPDRAPITSFAIKAEVQANRGVQSNELSDISYRYLAPDLIRFGLDGDRETGRGPMRRDDGTTALGYWLRDKDLVVDLGGRENKEDRDLVRRMTTIAQNVAALSDPSKLRVLSLELRDPPAFLPSKPKELAWKAERLTWIELQSPDFDLFRDAPAPADGAAAPRIFRVTIGADPKDHRPLLVALREEAGPGRPAGEPLLFELRQYRTVGGYLLPHRILVRGYEPGSSPPVFQERPAQEIAVLAAELNAPLSPADFAPPAPKGR